MISWAFINGRTRGRRGAIRPIQKVLRAIQARIAPKDIATDCM